MKELQELADQLNEGDGTFSELTDKERWEQTEKRAARYLSPEKERENHIIRTQDEIGMLHLKLEEVKGGNFMVNVNGWQSKQKPVDLSRFLDAVVFTAYGSSVQDALEVYLTKVSKALDIPVGDLRDVYSWV